ncbi:MAG TPA: FlgD immunoglobulin-like domain containing protein [Bacteroidota bacterium]|nr:FlgD immunoglobulin-like domain containing protein [Candidatus Kapabacteria bacterium]HRS01225.1 FlgD immunoglobulin-like domain containing protein [Bacteroidota bacterium]
MKAILHLSIFIFIIESFISNTLFSQDNQNNYDIRVPDYGSSIYAPYQDSIYNKLLKMNVPARTLFKYNLALGDAAWQDYLKEQNTLPYNAAMQSLANLPSTVFQPSGVEQTLYQTNLEMAQYVPGLNSHLFGIKVPLSDIAQVLGLTEDVSPEIVYSIDATLDVEIVIYSIQAKVIATIYKGKQNAGSYKITWNLRDDYGRRMPSGDYIAEVRIGDSKFVRKRIVIP